MRDTIHLHIFRSSDICDQNKHPATVNFQMSLSALNGLFVLKVIFSSLQPFYLSATCSLSLSCSFSQHAENRLGLKGLLFNWKHLGSRELGWWGAVETGYYGISTSLASDWWRRERRWRGFRGEAATQQPHHSSPSPQRYEVSGTATAGRRGSGCVNNTRDGLASELTVCL